MSAAILRFPVDRQRTPPAPVAPSLPTPAVVISYVADRHRVCVLWGPGSGTFPDYDKARRYAERLSEKHQWPLVNLAARGAA